MKHNYSFNLILILVIVLNACNSKNQNQKDSNSSIINNPYFGQKPPGLLPEPFAPGIVATDNWESSGVFTPDLQEFYFIREIGKTEEEKKMKFMVFQYKDNRWQDSIISKRVGQPFISPDGKTMHLGKNYMERTENGDWSAIKRLDSAMSKFSIMRLTSSSKGTYVFDAMGEGVLRFSQITEGIRENPQLIEGEINGGTANAHPFIAPDESYIIWDSRRESGYGKSDLYVSFKKDEKWSEAINLGNEINTAASENGAYVTPDGKYLLFNRSVGKVNPTNKYEDVNIFWVDAKIIETLRPN